MSPASRSPTAGRDLLDQGRRQRTAYLERRLRALSADDRAVLAAAAPALERLLDDPDVAAMTPLRRVAGRTFSSAFTSRNLRLYFAGSSVSQVGTWIQLVALPWLVLHITHSGAMLGLTYALQFFPILVFGAWAGVIADRHDKRSS